MADPHDSMDDSMDDIDASTPKRRPGDVVIDVSTPNRRKIGYQGFLYCLGSINEVQNRILWRCSKRSCKFKCNGRLWTAGDLTDPDLKVEHNHPPSRAYVEVARVKAQIQAQAQASALPDISQILGDSLIGVEDATLAALPKETSLRYTCSCVFFSEVIFYGKMLFLAF